MEFYQIKAKIKVNWNLWNSSPSVRLIKFFYNSSSCKPKLIDDINFSESFITQYWKKGATKIMKAFSGQATGWTSRCKSSRLLEQSTWIEIIIFKKDFWLNLLITLIKFLFFETWKLLFANLWRWKFSAIFRILGVGPKGCCADVILSSIQRVEQCSDWISIPCFRGLLPSPSI